MDHWLWFDKMTPFSRVFKTLYTCGRHNITEFEFKVFNKKLNKTDIFQSFLNSKSNKTNHCCDKRDFETKSCLCCVVIIDDSHIIIGARGKLLPDEIPLDNKKATKHLLNEKFKQIRNQDLDFTDSNNLIITAKEHIVFNNIIMVFECVIDAGFTEIGIAKLRN